MDNQINELKQKRVVIFGTESRGCCGYLIQNEIYPLYFVDDNSELEHISYRDMQFVVYKFQTLENEDRSNLAVVIAQTYPECNQTAARLSEIGIPHCFYFENITT